MRRTLALGLAAMAVAACLALIGVGVTCGMKRVSEPCETAGACAAASECVPYVHPLLVPFSVAAVVAGIVVWTGYRGVAMGIGLLVAGLGALSVFSLGFWGVVIGALLVGAGVVAPPHRGWERAERALAIGAVSGLVVGGALFVRGATTANMTWVYAGALGPVTVWCALLAWVLFQRRPSRD